jgi:hypothetical protein
MTRSEQIQDEMKQEVRKLNKSLQEETRKYIDLDSRFKEAQMMNRIKDLEQTQVIAELRQKLSSLDVKVSHYDSLFVKLLFRHLLSQL